MVTLTLIATIIHMNMGFEFAEALARGFGSALICFALSGLVLIIFCVIATLLKNRW